ncbi:MAG: hypothetical protein GX491_19390 [Chloroflexi bacterium]|nr:hypothetical protein [Chloroflexota bacterium]
MILYQPLDFDLVPSDLFVPKILPGVFGYAGDCRYSVVRWEEDLGSATLEDIYAANSLDPIIWLTYITHPAIADCITGEISLDIFSFEQDCLLFDWVDCQVYLGEYVAARAFLDHVRAGWLLPPARRVPFTIQNLKSYTCDQEGLIGLLRITLDQRLRLN